MSVSAHRSILLRVAGVVIACALPAIEARAHGNVVAEEDVCLIKIGFYTAHFSVFQPRSRQHFEFCEDLPEVEETVFVLDFLHETMRTVPVDFRIVRDSLALGRFAQWEDLARMDLAEETVFYQSPKIQADGVFVVLHQFSTPGDFIGVVTATNPQGSKVYRAVFPFRVGGAAWTGIVAVTLAALAVAGGGWLLRSRRLPGRARAATTMVSCLILLALPAGAAAAEPVSSQAGIFRASYETRAEALGINQMHSWIVHLEDSSGMVVEDATIIVSGGMPLHDHGLPTAPRVTRYLGDGNYLIEGMKFHMNGHWQVVLTVSARALKDVVVFQLEL